MGRLYKTRIKRGVDIACSLAGMVGLSWLIAGTAVIVRAKLGSPVIFKQERTGMGGKTFTLRKFRTMSDERDADGKLLPDNQRLTSLGKLLRASSIDELPELWNILRGDMSVVGPRPWPPSYLPYFTEEEMHRHDVRPGLTGLAQVRGRTAATWGDRLRNDLEYVRDVSFIGDARIVLATVQKVFKRSDIVEAGSQGNFDTYRRAQWERGEVERPQGA